MLSALRDKLRRYPPMQLAVFQLSLAAIVLAIVGLASTGAWPAYAHLRDPTPAPRPFAAASAPQPASAGTADAQAAEGGGRQDLSPDAARLWNASIPLSNLPNPAAKPFRLAAEGVLDEVRATDCMTAAIYYEAGYESPDGQRAVAQVVLNRLRNPLFPKTVCGVVFQGSERPGCQFTFTCNGALARRPSDEAWDRAHKVAVAALHGYVMKAVGNATHYHADYVAPEWGATLVKVAVVGQHIFYRWTGGLGLPPAFRGRYAGGEMQDLQIATLDHLGPGSEELTIKPVTQPAAAQATPPAPVVEAPAVKPAQLIAQSAGDQMVDASAVVAQAGPILKPDDLDWQGRPRAKGPPRLARPPEDF
jgi:cell wall hydrolase